METNNQLQIYIVTGGKGYAGSQLVETVLAQFPHHHVPVHIFSGVVTPLQITNILSELNPKTSIVAHTLVDAELRLILLRDCNTLGIKEIDLIGNLTNLISGFLNEEPLNKPGMYRQVKHQYFDRIEAIEFTLSTDDGMSPKKLFDADIVLTGVSRTGKTPLSVYLAMYGWKVSNIPLVYGIRPPKELFEIDRGRVFGLNIQLPFLVAQRKKRVAQMGVFDNQNYLGEDSIAKEINFAKRVFETGGFNVINITNKPIETTANEIIKLIKARYASLADKGE